MLRRIHIGPKTRFVLGCIAVVMMAGAYWLAALIWFKPFNINHFYERVFIRYALMDPELLTSLRLLEPFGLDFHNDDLTDVSDAHAIKLGEFAKHNLEVLESYDTSRQSSNQRLSSEIFRWFLSDAVDGIPYRLHNYPVNQLFGVQNDLPTFMATMHQIHTESDARNYITRLSKFDTKFDQVLEGLRIREGKGIIPPKFVVQRVLVEMKGFISQDPKENILYAAAAKLLEKAEAVDASTRQRLLAEIEAEIKKTVYPSYEKLIAYMVELDGKATTDDGVWKLPAGDEFYAYALHSETTSTFSPEEVHEIGLSEVSRVQLEMREILNSLGLTDKTVAEHMRDLRQDPRFLYPNSSEGKAQCLKDYQAIIDEVDRGLGDAFNTRPQVGVRVEPIPAFKEKTAPGAYYNSPALDGSRPGLFFANLRDMSEISKFGMRTLAYHEAIPGHHFQIAVQQELKGVPTFRRVLPFTAYVEGWALYAERLAWELGFEKDPYDNLGRLQGELFRAVRLVVDTGIHRMRWTREEAIQYMLNNTGMAEGDVVAEIERYIVNPGQACAYKIGMMKILELRELAKAELGSGVTLSEFHDVVLTNGAMPLEILDSVVREYISERKESLRNAVSMQQQKQRARERR